MKFKSKGISKKPGRLSSCIVFYIAALVTALMGIVLLVNNVIMFRKTVNQYVAQGYSANIVLEQLVPSQLLPGIFQVIIGMELIAPVQYLQSIPEPHIDLQFF